jgi:hypothetical protein
MTSKSDSSNDVVLVYDQEARPEGKIHRFFVDGREALIADEESGSVEIAARSQAEAEKVFAAFQFLDQACLGGEH